MGEKKEKVIDIRGRFDQELSEINYLLNGLKEGRVYGVNGNISQMDGSLQHYESELRKKISSLITKIEYGKESSTEKMMNELLKYDI
ncbi:hypothetical protein MHI39_20085 [Heyndrickxia sp. FSL K6-6286]|uniref:hypothetical protein n=1 Tax=Heyndrickxia sp. FSL K6-6286 TaxID=2921510 RepID=UPI00217D714B|nr:hypothetical protein [Heyndrickxia oleronia]